jgi:hypothetical protein
MMAGVKSIGERKFPIILLKTNGFSSNFAEFYAVFTPYVGKKSISSERETEPAL